ncbi:ATP-binding protein [Pedobacter duraquae]|uniref:histidine kinase n=1 Tax=Pedobacter duraquae TaxID=425511 RepID=A0A4R6IMC2_9SPHI|nr:ATP-binding protein [Pedobacter duraquae]TDO23293.1 signal transduction histidine kinase [Pedobacter duraquae]
MKFSYVDRQLDKVLGNDHDPLNKERVKFLINLTLLSSVVVFITIPLYMISGPMIQVWRSCIVLVFMIGIVYSLLRKPIWRNVSHAMCLIVSFVIWSNLLIFVMAINIATIQFTLLVIIFAFYMLGTRWGVFYALLNILPILFYAVFNGKEYIHINITPRQLSTPAFMLVMINNFVLFVFMHHHIFTSYNLTIKKLRLKQIEEELLNAKLLEAIEIAAQSSRSKTDFLSTMSHELRTPLNSVIGMSNILLKDQPRDDQAENLNILNFSAQSLLTLINDVLDFSKIESGKIELEHIPFRISELVQQISLGFKVKSAEKGLTFHLEVDPFLIDKVLIGDPTRLTQILYNLLENAIKFTPAGVVCLKINAIVENSDVLRVEFIVSDTGIGIPDDKKALIFEPFSQASSTTTRKYGGTGLGLSIVKHLIEIHNSRLELTSRPAAGTTFTFSISYQIGDSITLAQHAPGSKVTAQQLSSLKVLIAEDNAMNILLMKKLLGQWNISPYFVENGADAVAAVEIQNFDVILMDIHMPVMDGYEATTLIRANPDPRKSSVHIIALTASVSSNVQEKMDKARLNDYVSKPFNPDLLKAKLESICYQQQQLAD